jgi:hypothetical protein
MRSSAHQQLSPLRDDWRSRLGTPVFETIADLHGAFPGYLECGARLDHVQLRVYESALTIDEGRNRGFLLPFGEIIATDEGEADSIEEQLIRIRYRDGADSRLFAIRPRANRLAIRGGRRSIRLLDELRARNVPAGPLDDIPVDAFVTNWGETDAFGNEAMVWHGHASASLMLTGDRFACDVFITSKSLVWGRDARSPISRVPLHAIRDVTPGQGGSRSQHPAAFIGIGDSAHDRIEFSFVFDTYDTEDRNALERSAFVVHLRSRPVPLAYPQAPQQPWLLPEHPEPVHAPIWPSSVATLRAPLGAGMWRPERDEEEPDQRTVAPFRDPAERLRPDRGVMTAHRWASPGDPVTAWPQPVLPIAEVIEGAAVEEPVASGDVVLSEWSVPETMPAIADTPASRPARAITVIKSEGLDVTPAVSTSAQLDPVRDFEVEILATLTEILDVIRRREDGDISAELNRRPPTGSALSIALEAIVDRMGRGDMAPDQATRRKSLLLGLDDAVRRLDVLLPLHANGAVTTAELRTRCDALCADLGAVLFAGTD